MAHSADIYGHQNDSDYGSDFSEEGTYLIDKLLAVEANLEASQDNPIVNELEHHDPPSTLRIPRIIGHPARTREIEDRRGDLAETFPTSGGDPGYPDLAKLVPGSLSTKPSAAEREQSPVDENDSRPPLARWRTKPRKALSVTDLVSPSWCELQYYYTLKYHGKKRATPAMKQGSVVHQTLEEQIYTTVRVEIETKEDAWGLRIWNVIQGLRTLAETGQTRELEVWGTIDGQVVNGVIDELSYICPDVELEERLNAELAKTKTVLPANQPTIAEFFITGSSTASNPAPKRKKSDKLYLCDVKTRAGRSLPTGAAFRPTQYQIMIYHSLLASLATNSVDFSILTDRYSLQPDKAFSDSFIAQIGSLNEHRSGDSEQWPSSQDSMTTILQHNNLSSLWQLMISTFSEVLPQGAESIGNVLKAEYRSRGTGDILGRKTFPMSEKSLKDYLETQMEWWKGERVPRGVQVEEAFKCRSCDFADTCEWRLEKVEEDKVRARKKKSRAGKTSSNSKTLADTDQIVDGVEAMSGAEHMTGVVESKIPKDDE